MFSSFNQTRTNPHAEEIGALSPDGTRLAVSGPHHTVEVCDAARTMRFLTYFGHQAGVYRRVTARIIALAWSPDRLRLASASSDGSLHVWDAQRGYHLRTLLEAAGDTSRAVTWCELAWSADGLSMQRGQEQTTWRL